MIFPIFWAFLSRYCMGYPQPEACGGNEMSVKKCPSSYLDFSFGCFLSAWIHSDTNSYDYDGFYCINSSL